MTPWERSPSGAPVPAGATPTSMTIVAGASKRMICQRSTLPGLPSWRRPERRRLDVAHPARHRGEAIGMADVERRFGDGAIADARAVDEGLVGQVHEVVDHQPVVAFHGDQLAVAGPGGIVVPVHVGDLRRVGERRVAGPHPDQAVALDHRKGAHRGGRIDRLLRRHEGAAAARIVGQAVIAADDLVAVEPAFRQRQQAMPAGVGERRDAAVESAVEHELLAADGTGQELALDLDVIGGGVPGVERERRRCSVHGRPPVFSMYT